jgi:hypothetical protein
MHPLAQTTVTLHSALVHLQGFQFLTNTNCIGASCHIMSKNSPETWRIICYLSWISGLDYSSRVLYFCSSSCQSMQGILGGRCAESCCQVLCVWSLDGTSELLGGLVQAHMIIFHNPYSEP